MESKAQAQTRTNAVVDPPPRNRDAKSPMLPAFIDKKDELDSYLLHFERYAENAKWEKNVWAIKLSALLTGYLMEMKKEYDQEKKSLLTRYHFIEDGYRKRFREVKLETEETPDQFIIRLKNYLAKWLERTVYQRLF